MARISDKHRRYRSKDEIARDVALVLAAPLCYGTKYAVVSEITWVWTEFFGKYKGCRHWFKMAVMQQKLYPKSKLLHEHVVPKRVVIKMLFDLPSPSPHSVHEICDKFLIGVVVTPEEDAVLNESFRSSMPPDFLDPKSPDFHDPWLRYKKYSIEVICR